MCYEKSNTVGMNKETYWNVHVVNDKNESMWLAYPTLNNQEPDMDMFKMYILSMTLGFEQCYFTYRKLYRNIYGKFTKTMLCEYEDGKCMADDLILFFGYDNLVNYAKEIGW